MVSRKYGVIPTLSGEDLATANQAIDSAMPGWDDMYLDGMTGTYEMFRLELAKDPLMWFEELEVIVPGLVQAWITAPAQVKYAVGALVAGYGRVLAEYYARELE